MNKQCLGRLSSFLFFAVSLVSAATAEAARIEITGHIDNGTNGTAMLWNRAGSGYVGLGAINRPNGSTFQLVIDDATDQILSFSGTLASMRMYEGRFRPAQGIYAAVGPAVDTTTLSFDYDLANSNITAGSNGASFGDDTGGIYSGEWFSQTTQFANVPPASRPLTLDGRVANGNYASLLTNDAAVDFTNYASLIGSELVLQSFFRYGTAGRINLNAALHIENVNLLDGGPSTEVPEPSSMLLLATSLVGLVVRRSNRLDFA